MKLVFVHGWSVTHTNTYGELPEALSRQSPEELELRIEHIYLSKYISFHDEVTVDDIARAFEQARKEQLGNDTYFSCITHSTGGPVIRAWVKKYYGDKSKLGRLPLRHLIMLAPANHGSALAQLGKARVGRMKAWWAGVEPGQGVLNWLELGSDGQRDLNLAWMNYKTAELGFYPIVITGETIDKKLYDYLNSYTAEKGSDGVVRVAAANLNYRHIVLSQNTSQSPFTVKDNGDMLEVYPLELRKTDPGVSQPCALEVIPKASHSGEKMGIMRSVKSTDNIESPVVRAVIDSLQVSDADEYAILSQEMELRTGETQSTNKYAMVVVRVTDDQGNQVKDYDLYLLAGNQYSPGILPKGFFVDKQKNRINNNHLTLYLNATRMLKIKDGKLGFRIIARPSEGFSYYTPGEFHSDDIPLEKLIKDNETLLVDIVLKRHVDINTFRLSPATDPREDFQDEEPGNIRAS
jgi:hypothetical protein